MKTKTSPFGHPSTRQGFAKADSIPFARAILGAENNLEAAQLSVAVLLLSGKGGALQAAFNKAAKDRLDTFQKANPDFQFKKLGRTFQEDKAPVKKVKKKAKK